MNQYTFLELKRNMFLFLHVTCDVMFSVLLIRVTTNQSLYQDQSCRPMVDLVNSQRRMMDSWICPSCRQCQQTVSHHQMKLLVQETPEMMKLILMISQGDLKT